MHTLGNRAGGFDEAVTQRAAERRRGAACGARGGYDTRLLSYNDQTHLTSDSMCAYNMITVTIVYSNNTRAYI